MRFKFVKQIKFLLVFTLVISNVFLGFPADYFISKLNKSKIVDNLYRALNDSRVIDRGEITIPTILKEALAADVAIDSDTSTTDAAQNNSSPQTVFVSDQVGYTFFVDYTATTGNNACVYRKTSDGGANWGSPVNVDSVNTGDCTKIAVWYDQWTPGDTTGTYIHIATFDIGVDDLYYTQLNTSGDGLSTTVLGTTQSATLTAAANSLSITKGTDGNLYMTTIDASDGFVIRCVEYGEASPYCTNAADWAEMTSPSYTLTNDWPLLMPLASGNIMLIRMELAGNDYDYKIWDGSNWSASWTTIDTTSGENTTYDDHFGATVDKSTNDIYFVYVTDNGTLGTDDDIRTAIYSGGLWDTTNPADVLTNDSKGITNAKISFDQNSGDVYVVYSARTTPGTAGTANVYWKKSTDGMASWGSENQLNDTADNIYGGGNVNIMSDERIYATWKRVSVDDYYGDTVADLWTADQYVYKWFDNLDSTDVGTKLAEQNTAATLGSSGAEFRLRLLLHFGKRAGASVPSLKLQFSEKSVDCDAAFSGESYIDVTADTAIAYNDQTPADGAALTPNGDDPNGGYTIVNQTYEELNNFTNSEGAIPSGQDGKWDFALKDNSAPADTSYCFRVLKSDDSQIDTYTVIPEVTTAVFSNQPPTINEVSLNSKGAINLIENSQIDIMASASVTDPQGCSDISGVKAIVYRYNDYTASCSNDQNNCYDEDSFNCVADGACSSNTQNYNCYASSSMQFFADPTDAGSSFSADEWVVTIIASDSYWEDVSSNSYDDNDETDVEVNSLTALSITAGDPINYGEVIAGQNTQASNQSLTIKNTGNRGMDIMVYGTNLTGVCGTITVGNQQYASTSFTYNDYGKTLLATPGERYYNGQISWIKPTSTTPITNNIYWGINIPEGTATGVCSGTNTFSATEEQ